MLEVEEKRNVVRIRKDEYTGRATESVLRWIEEEDENNIEKGWKKKGRETKRVATW